MLVLKFLQTALDTQEMVGRHGKATRRGSRRVSIHVNAVFFFGIFSTSFCLRLAFIQNVEKPVVKASPAFFTFQLRSSARPTTSLNQV